MKQRASRYRGCLILPGNRVQWNVMGHAWVALRPQNDEPFAFCNDREGCKRAIDELLDHRPKVKPLTTDIAP